MKTRKNQSPSSDNDLPSWWNTSKEEVIPVCWLVISRKIKDPIQSDHAIDRRLSNVKINNGISTKVVVTRNGVDYKFDSISKALKMLDIRMTIYKYRYAKSLHDNGLCSIGQDITIRRLDWNSK